MTENILLDIRRGVLETAERAIRSWKTEQRTAGLARRVEELLSVCLRWPQENEEAIRRLWKRAAAGLIEDFQKTGQQVLDLFDDDLTVLASLRETIRLLEEDGHPIQDSTKLGGALDELRRMREHFVERWLWISEEMIEEARAEYGRDEYQSIREILDGIPGSNPQVDP